MTGPGRFLFAVILCYLTMVATGDEGIKEIEEKDDTTESSSHKITYQGSQVISICENNSNKFTKFTSSLLDDKDLEYWGRNETCNQYYVSSEKVDDVKAKLSKSGLPFSIMIEDLQRAIDTENPIPEKVEDGELVGEVGHRMTWTSYHRLDDIYGYMDYLAQTYPQLVTVETLGSSVEGRLIKYAKVSSGQPNAKSFWIDGGIHAREWISSASVSYILYELVENRDAHIDQIKEIDYFILPVMNPDGYEYTHTRDRLWRKNRSNGSCCQGTDLNRNWSFKWGGKDSSQDQCEEIYGGRRAFSEPETRAVSNFIQSSVPNAQGFLTFHSYGQYILYPYGYDTDQLPEDYEDLDRVGWEMAKAMRQAGGQEYTVGNSANSLYPASGGSHDWAKGVANIKYSYTIELRDTGSFGFVLPSQFIQPTAEEALAAVIVMSAEIQALS